MKGGGARECLKRLVGVKKSITLLLKVYIDNNTLGGIGLITSEQYSYKNFFLFKDLSSTGSAGSPALKQKQVKIMISLLWKF